MNALEQVAWDSEHRIASHKPPECIGCPLYTAPGPVRADGTPLNDTWLIGEAPGPTELDTGLAWTGGAGRFMSRLLPRPRATYHITNVVLCMPPAKREPTLQESAHCAKAHLFPKIHKYKPKALIPMGNAALELFTGRTGIMAARGYIFDWAGFHVIPTLNPAALMKRVGFKEVFTSDVRKATRIGQGGYKPLPELNLVSLDRLIELAYERRYITLDIETNQTAANKIPYWDAVLTALGLGWVDAQCVLTPPWDRPTVAKLGALLRAPWLSKLTHNGSFDVVVLRSIGFPFAGRLMDTIQLHHAGYAELPHKLEFLGSLYLDIASWKGMRKTTKDEVK